jgi:stage II sporulation protein R
MKNVVFIITLLGLIVIVVFGFLPISSQSADQSNLLRLHIRANSNSITDQDIKYKVKEEIVNLLTPMFINVTTKEESINKIKRNITLIESTANKVLRDNGFTYTASAGVKNEYFPVRSYNGYEVQAGIYDALILNLGQGEGDNWWCVIYPPLCFTENTIDGGRGVIYKSRLTELIKKFFS